jgi:hypothetical protein
MVVPVDGLPTWGNGGCPGRLRNAGLCHFPLDVAKNFFVGFFLLIFLQRHKSHHVTPGKARTVSLDQFFKKLTTSRTGAFFDR